MAPEQWTAVPWTSLADEPFTVFIDTMKTLVATPDGFLRSKTGRIAMIVGVETLSITEDIEVRLSRSMAGTTNVAWMLINTDRSSFTEEIQSLSAVVELVAIPTTLSQALPDTYSNRGQIIQQVDSTLIDTFDVFERRATALEMLTRDAPTSIGEESDNLSGRANWFRKHHGRDPEAD